jgi:hypothetical protein
VVGDGSDMGLLRQAPAHAQPFPGSNGDIDMSSQFTNTTDRIDWPQPVSPISWAILRVLGDESGARSSSRVVYQFGER